MPSPPARWRFVTIAVLTPLLLATLAVWLGSENRRSERLRADVRVSFNARLMLGRLIDQFNEAESAQRGFLITGDASFLRPYAPARRQVRAILAAPQLARDPVVAARLPSLHRLASAKFVEMDGTIARRRAGDTDIAETVVRDGGGKRMMDGIRDTVTALATHEERSTATATARYSAHILRVRVIVWLVVALFSLSLLAGLWLLWRGKRARYLGDLETYEAAERYRTILDSTIDAILILNPSGTIESLNAAATAMLGYGPDTLTRRDITVLMDLAPGEGSFHQRIGLVDGALRHAFLPDRNARHRDGHAIAVDVAMGVMALPSGTHIVVSLRDIAERKRIERLKDDLISTISHELRTPLTSVVGSLELLRAGAAGALPPQASRLVDIAENNSRRLIRLINDMLDIDRIESGKLQLKREAIDLREIVLRAKEDSEGLAAGRGIILASQAPEASVPARGDPDRLLQVLANLLSNAVKVSPQGGSVTIGLEIEARGEAIIWVDDGGAGIPPAFRDRIFGRFERAEPQDGPAGTGLGLAISREIVTRHGGRIWFADRAEGGTRFAFALPLLSPGGEAGALRVLICEQDTGLAAQLAAMVADEGCVADLVASTGDARAAVAQQDYAALLIDVSLPTEGGLPLTRALRDREPPVETPIIVVANRADGAPASIDVIDWLSPPLDQPRLAHALRTAIGRTGSATPLILHVDDDQDILDVTAAALQPEARIVKARDLVAARAFLAREAPDLAILDLQLADGSGLDLLPALVDAHGLAIPTIIYSAQDAPAIIDGSVDAIVTKARDSLPNLKATLRRVLSARAGGIGE